MTSPGRSYRTPAKHGLMNRVIGAEVGVANSKREIQRLLWLDLSAGDAIVPDGMDWERNCSPGLLAYHARGCAKPVEIVLYEIKPATFDRLMVELDRHLPAFGYVRIGETSWRFEQSVTLRAVNDSGAQASLYGVGTTAAVLVLNDPNAITDWVMRPTFAQEVCSRTLWFRSVSTMGCNPAGLKRLGLDERLRWFDLIDQQEASLPPHRDLLLAAIRKDDAQWAYLLAEPAKWTDRVHRAVVAEFRKRGMGIDLAWYRTEPERYQEIKRRLFLTKAEREAS
jgi:hypothetical protein